MTKRQSREKQGAHRGWGNGKAEARNSVYEGATSQKIFKFCEVPLRGKNNEYEKKKEHADVLEKKNETRAEQICSDEIQ